MSYSLFRSSYDGNLLLGKPTPLQELSPFRLDRGSALHPEPEPGSAAIAEGKHSGARVLQAKGQVQDFNRPDFSNTKIEVDYDTQSDLAEAAAIARRPEFRRGSVRLTGHGSWSARDFSSIGKVLLSNLDWRDSPVGVHNANLSAQYALNPKRITLSQIQGRVLGGSVSGDAEVNQWLNPQPAMQLERKRKRKRKGRPERCASGSRICPRRKLRRLCPRLRVRFTRSNRPVWPAALWKPAGRIRPATRKRSSWPT